MNEMGEIYPASLQEPNRIDRIFISAYRSTDKRAFGDLVIVPPIAIGIATGVVVESMLDNDAAEMYEAEINAMSSLEARKAKVDALAQEETGEVREHLNQASEYLTGQMQANESKIPPDAMPYFGADAFGASSGLAVAVVGIIAMTARGRKAVRKLRAWETKDSDSRDSSQDKNPAQAT